MALDFSNRRVVVCGGSRGIGRAIALGFAAGGAAVSICARGADGLAAAKADGNLAHTGVCDLADAAAITRYVGDAAAALGGIDILVNNASGFGMTDDAAGWGAGFAVDMMAIVHASHAAMPHLEKATAASIVSVSSISAMRPSARSAPYGAMKAAVIHYTTSQAMMLAAKGIRVNAVAPGSIEFPGGTWGKAPRGGLARLRRRTRQHQGRPPRHAGGGRRCRAVPGLPHGPLGHRPDHRRGWRPAAVQLALCRW